MKLSIFELPDTSFVSSERSLCQAQNVFRFPDTELDCAGSDEDGCTAPVSFAFDVGRMVQEVD